MEKIGTGRKAEAYALDGERVVKLYYPGESKEYAQSELDLMRAVSAVYPGAPKVYGLTEIDGRYGLVMERVHGRMLLDEILRHPAKLPPLFRRFGALHREIHRCPFPDGRTAAGRFLPRLQKAKGIRPGLREKAAGFLQSHPGSALCHGDFHPLNVMADSSGAFRLIDWMDAYSGNPMLDAARTCYLLTSGQAPGKSLLGFPPVRFALGRIMRREYLKGYFAGEKIPRKELAMWEMVVWLCRLGEVEGEEDVLSRRIKRREKQFLAFCE